MISFGSSRAADHPRLSSGTRLNSIYEIDYPLMSHGRADIYKGHSVQTGDPVAIKILPTTSDANAQAALLRTEAAVLQQIQHDAVVRYYMFTVDPVLRRPYLTMEFVDGPTLADVLKQGSMSFEAAQSLLCRTASGLQAAHDRGIIHGSLSPDKIILANSDVRCAKIIGFGMTRTTHRGTMIAGVHEEENHYVAPEQLGLFGGNVSPKTDMYSLALVIVQALTGRPVDMGGSHFQMIEARRRVPALGTVDMRLRPLLERMLQPDPALRPESMTEIATLAAGMALPKKMEKWRPRWSVPEDRRRKWIRYGAVGVLVLMVCSAGAALYLHPPFGAGSGLHSPSKPAETAALRPGSQQGGLPTDKVKAYIEGYDGGNCFLLTPSAITPTSVRIEAIGSAVEPFRRFDTAFKQAMGFDADIGLHEVTGAQCPAVTFLARLRAKNFAPQIRIDRDLLRSGEVLTGALSGVGGQQIALFLVSNSGTVQNISSLLKPGFDAKTFNIGLRPVEGASGRQPQLLIAVAADAELPILQITRPLDAQQFFARVLSDAEGTRSSLSASGKYFMLDN